MAITHDLTKTLEGKEIEIYKLLCENLSNKEISQKISMPVPTLATYLRRIYKKLGLEGVEYGDAHLIRRKAILYSGTKIEQVVTYEQGKERGYSIKEIRTAGKKTGLSIDCVNDLISFLEMEN